MTNNPQTRTLKNDRLLRALACQPVDRPPVWLMRQAGRYLPEYLELRAQAGSFMNLCRNAELATEVAMQPLRRFGLDASILFSDILTIPDAMGLELEFVAGEGPVFNKPISTRRDIEQLKMPDMQADLGYVMNVVSSMRSELGNALPLIGFSGSPWTLACYMLEGQGTRDFATARAWLWKAPDAVQLLLDKLADSCSDYLAAQAEAGADVLMLFDTWGGLLSSAHYQQFSLSAMRKILRNLRDKHKLQVPVMFFSKGCHTELDVLCDSGADGLGVDWRISIDAALAQVAGRAAVQGNLDPTVLLSDPDTIAQTVQGQFARAVHQPGFIFNLGHGIMQQTPPDHVTALMQAVHQLSD